MGQPLPAHAPNAPKYENAKHHHFLWHSPTGLTAADTSAGRAGRQWQKHKKNVAAVTDFELIFRPGDFWRNEWKSQP
jgi:hypothetical protein